MTPTLLATSPGVASFPSSVNGASTLPTGEREVGILCCEREAVNYITCRDYAWGGNPHYGSLRRYACAECTEQVRAIVEAEGLVLVVQPLALEPVADGPLGIEGAD